MAQSYKTNKRAALLFNFRKYLLCMGLLGLFGLVSGLAWSLPANTGKRTTQFFTHFTYRFLVPEKLAPQVWQYLEKQHAAALPATEDQTTDFYFDDEAGTLKKQQIMLRLRIIFSREDRKERIQLIFPPSGNAETGRIIVFRHNRKPDKGAGFTTHPLLKLLRNKDRPVLDSLLKPLKIAPEKLKPVLEITETRRQLQLQKNQSAWVVFTFTQLRSAAPEYEFQQIQISPDNKLLTFGSEEVKKQLLLETQQIARNLQQQFPELQAQTQTEYAAMQEIRQRPSPAHTRSKALFGLGLLVFIIVLFVFYKFRKNRKAEF